MAILNTPYTLPLAKSTPEISTIFFDVIVTETINTPTLYTDIIDATAFGSVAVGKGIINTYKTKLLEIKDRPKNPTHDDMFGAVEAEVKQEALIVDTYEYVKLSTEYDWTKEAFTTGEATRAYNASLSKLVQDTMGIDMYRKKLMPFFQGSKWGNKKQITGWDTSTPTSITEKNQQMSWNAKKVAEFIRNRSIVYTVYNNNLTDIAGVETALRPDDLRLYVDSAFMSHIDAALSGVYNQENLRKLLGVNEIVMIPNHTGTLDTTGPVAFLCHKRKVAHTTGYMVSRAFSNHISLYNDVAAHRGMGVGMFSGLAGEALYLQTPPTPNKAKKEEAVKNSVVTTTVG